MSRRGEGGGLVAAFAFTVPVRADCCWRAIDCRSPPVAPPPPLSPNCETSDLNSPDPAPWCQSAARLAEDKAPPACPQAQIAPKPVSTAMPPEMIIHNQPWETFFRVKVSLGHQIHTCRKKTSHQMTMTQSLDKLKVKRHGDAFDDWFARIF